MTKLEVAGIIAAIVSGWLTAALGWFKWWHELVTKRKEKAAKEKAEAELTAIRRRAFESAPYLALSNERFNSLIFDTEEPGKAAYVMAGSRQLLCFLRNEVETSVEAGSEIFLVIENRGSNAQEVRLHLDGTPARIFEMQVDKSGPHIPVLRYLYNPSLHGKEQTLEIKFLAPNGARETHRYSTVHGVRALKRVDPA